MLTRWLPFVAILLPLLACPSSPARDRDDDDAGPSSSSSSTGAGGAGGSKSGTLPREICAKYLECLSQNSPTELGIALDAYGDTGSCWNGGDETLCADACLTGLAQHHASDPGSCPECFEAAHCPDGEGCFSGSCGLCDLNVSCSECVTFGCGESICGEQAAACTADPSCSAAWECARSCIASGEPTCSSCPAVPGSSWNIYDALTSCVCGTCSDNPSMCDPLTWTCGG